MKPNTTLNSDKEALEEAAKLQSKSKDALHRLQQDLEQTQQAGAMTLDDLYAQRRKLEGIESQGDRLHETLDETEKLQRKLGTWFGGFGAGTSKKKKVEATPDQKENNQNDSTDKKKKWKFRKSSKKSEKSDGPVLNVRKGLLEGEDIPLEHKDELNALARGDEELDAQMDLIGNQLKNILDMTQEIGTESKNHGQRLDKVNTQIADANQRQKKANKKARRLLN